MDFGIAGPQVLLLKAALSCDKAEAAAGLEQWWQGIDDFDAVRGTDSALFPRIYWNLGPLIRDQTLAARLKGAARHRWLRNQYLIASAGELIERLARADVPVLLLKGAAIATAMDEDAGLRAMSDCDMLVPKARALEVLDLLHASGLLERGRIDGADLDLVHGVTLGLRRNRHAMFDIHWRPLRGVGADELADEMFAGAQRADFAGRACLVPCPEHLVFHAIVHGVEWSPHPRYDWLIDTVRILRRTAARFDWGRLAGIAQRYRYGFLVRAALAEAVDKAGLAIPAAAGRHLGRAPAILERMEARLRRSRPAALSVPQELLLALQTIRRRDSATLARPALSALPALLKSFYGSPSGDRSFIHNDRKQRITFLQGWSAPDATGRWTEGKLVSLALHAPKGSHPAMLSLRGLALPDRAAPTLSIDVFAGLRRLQSLVWRRSGPDPHVQAIHLPPRIWRKDTAILRFRIRHPISPIEIGMNGDTRALGLFLEHLAVDPVARDLAGSALDFSNRGADAAVLWHGWSRPEPLGCWTVGPLALLYWQAAREIPAYCGMRIEVALVAPGSRSLRGAVAINGGRMTRFRCAPSQGNVCIDLPMPRAIAAGESVEVRIEIDNPRAPARTTGSADGRSLGLCVRRIALGLPGRQS